MWRAPLPISPGVVESDLSRVARMIGDRSRERAHHTQRHGLVAELRSVSRRAATPPRARRFDVLLCDRALAVRYEMLEVAAALDRTSQPSGRTLEALRQLLRDGCDSPLYNPAVPEERLRMALDRIRIELQSCEPADVGTLAISRQDTCGSSRQTIQRMSPGEADPRGHRGAEGAVGRA
jgi:hypothetical protein